MAVFGNFKGTTKPDFTIGKGGAKIFGRPVQPASPGDDINTGDLWIDSANTSVKVYDGASWNDINTGLLNIVEDTTPQLGGNLLTNGNNIHVEGAGATQAEIKLYEAPNNGSNYVALRSNSLLFNSYTLTLPITAGSDGQVLTTDGSGVLYFTTPSAGGISNLVEDTTPQLGGELDTNGNDIRLINGVLSMQAGANSGSIYGANVYLGNLLGTAGYLNIEGDGAGTAGRLRVSGDVTLNNISYPSADGTNGQFLQTDGSGNLSFADTFDGAYSSLTGAPTNVSSFTNDAGYITGYTVTEGDVTAHEAALSITKSQVTDLATSDLDLGANKILYSNVYSDLVDLPDASSYHGMFAHVHATGKAYYAHAGSWVELANVSELFDGAYSSLTGAPTNVSSFTNDAGYLTSETTTTLTADSVNQRLVFTNETGTPANIDLSWAVDDTNLARLTSGTVDANTGIATFTRDDATDFTVDFSALFDDTNLTRITSGSVSGNDLTLTRSDATTVVIDVTSLNAAGGISNVVEDTTPQLGGDLDNNGNNIQITNGNLLMQAGANSGGIYGSIVYLGNLLGTAGTLVIEGDGVGTPGRLDASGNIILNDLTYPSADGTNGQALTTDGSGNLSFADVSVETDRYAYEDTKTFVVTVDTKDSTHPQFNNGSANGYKIDGAFAPFLHMVPGMTYRFDQSDASNSTHPLAFYYDENKTTSYTDGVTNNGTPGSAGAYTQIVVSDTTPSTLYYQCSVHSLMGWGANISTHNLTGLDTDDLTEGAGNLYYTTSRFNTDFGNKSTSDLSEGTNLYHTTERVRTAINATGDISYNSTTGTISFNNSSGYLTSETYSTPSELLTAIKTVDGASSGLEADLLDGQEGSYYLNYSNLSNAPTSILNFGITDGTAGQVLQTDGSGNFSFTTVSGGGGGGVGYTGFEDYFFNVSSQTSTFGTSADAHDKVQVFVNGVYLDDSDFTFNATTGIVTLTTAAESGDEVSVWGFNSTGLTNHELFTVDGSGNIEAPGTIQIGNHRKEGSLTSTIASTSPTDVLLYLVNAYVGAKLIITVKDNVTGDTQISEALILTDPDQVAHQITTYGTMYTSTNALATFDAGIYASYVPLTVTMASSNSSTVKVAYTLIYA